MSRSLLVIAGEPSGDQHAARLVAALRRRAPDIVCWGIGGDALAAEGVELLRHVDDMAVMGLSEVLRRYGFFRRVFRELAAAAAARRPDAVLLVDYPGFNLRFARLAHRLGLKVVYYICPQVWAWHRSRMRLMARTVDLLLVLFPFEAELFEGLGLRVLFAGHPLAEEDRGEDALPSPPWDGEPRLALLPGSRKQEVRGMLPVMLRAAGLVREAYPNLGLMIAAPSGRVAEWNRLVIDEAGAGSCPVTIGCTRTVLRTATAALITSGTATVEAALAGCPMVIAYKTAALTFLLGRLLVKVPHIGMVNLLAKRELCPEFIQRRATPEALAAAVLPLLDAGSERRQEMKMGLREVADSLQGSGGLDRAAQAVVDLLSAPDS